MALKDTLSALFGTAWHVNSDAICKGLADAIDGASDVTPGTVTASQEIVVDANKHFDIANVTTLAIGASGSEVAVTTTPARLNALALPDAQYSTAALQSAQMTGAEVAGAKVVAFENTGVTPANLQMPLATAIVAAMPGAQVGQSYLLKIRNSSSGANTATITTATGITLHGTMTIAQNVTRDFLVVLTTLTAVDVYSLGVSGAGA